MTPLLLALALTAAPKAAPKPAPTKPAAGVAAPAQLEQAGEVREIELDEKRARAVYRVRTAISIPAVVEFPEAFAAPPVCGDCAFLKGDQVVGSGLFALSVSDSGHYLTIKPALFPGPQPDGTTIPAGDFVTTVTVRLSSFTLTLQVELVEDKHQATPSVRFIVPGRPAESRYVTEAVAKAKAELDASFASRVEAAAAQHLLRSLLEPHECRASSLRQRTEDVVVEMAELCRFGHRVYLRFTVENRGRALFAVGDTTVSSTPDGQTFTPVEPLETLFAQPEVTFQQQTGGVVSFDLPAEEGVRTTLELKLAEKGGRGRVIALRGIAF